MKTNFKTMDQLEFLTVCMACREGIRHPEKLEYFLYPTLFIKNIYSRLSVEQSDHLKKDIRLNLAKALKEKFKFTYPTDVMVSNPVSLMFEAYNECNLTKQTMSIKAFGYDQNGMSFVIDSQDADDSVNIADISNYCQWANLLDFLTPATSREVITKNNGKVTGFSGWAASKQNADFPIEPVLVTYETATPTILRSIA